ncbi:MAG: hypothetical protein ABS98_02820 [Lysobacteraceae bacterium SCN 69-48]|jgi:HemY protein|nr:MAG: hypothetical protein ABS98_02820 [Xanthomonadaceae bacterium SCN 69-48]
MNLFRNVLVWLLLAVLGAVLVQFLLQDPGYLLIRYRGTDYSTTLAVGIGLLLAGLFALALLWAALRLPFRLWNRRRKRRARAQLVDGLAAFERGDYLRAGQLLRQAMDEPAAEAVARAQAARAAFARGDDATGEALLEGFEHRHAGIRAVVQAERALARQQPEAALHALDAAAAQPLPPRGLWLRAQALVASGRSAEAYGLLGALRQQQALPAAEGESLPARWAAQALREADDGNAIAGLWDALPPALRTHSDVAAAYAGRAAALGWHEAATGGIERALDAGWDDALAALYGQLDVDRLDARRAQLERWLQARPANPALLLASARIDQRQGRWLAAEDTLHRAIAAGAGAPAWEALGDGAARLDDHVRAQRCYANALRSQRGETVLEPADPAPQALPLAAQVVTRDPYGTPRLSD